LSVAENIDNVVDRNERNERPIVIVVIYGDAGCFDKLVVVCVWHGDRLRSPCQNWFVYLHRRRLFATTDLYQCSICSFFLFGIITKTGRIPSQWSVFRSAVEVRDLEQRLRARFGVIVPIGLPIEREFDALNEAARMQTVSQFLTSLTHAFALHRSDEFAAFLDAVPQLARCFDAEMLARDAACDQLRTELGVSNGKLAMLTKQYDDERKKSEQIAAELQQLKQRVFGSSPAPKHHAANSSSSSSTSSTSTSSPTSHASYLSPNPSSSSSTTASNSKYQVSVRSTNGLVDDANDNENDDALGMHDIDTLRRALKRVQHELLDAQTTVAHQAASLARCESQCSGAQRQLEAAKRAATQLAGDLVAKRPSARVSAAELCYGATRQPYTVYVIGVALGAMNYSVRRRYSEFDALHKSLGIAFPEQLLPSLPPKTSLIALVSGADAGNPTSDLRVRSIAVSICVTIGVAPATIEARRRALDTYLSNLSQMPVISSSVEFQVRQATIEFRL
jgi:predicted  nucleic acid-binding Zn-ribbon protein